MNWATMTYLPLYYVEVSADVIHEMCRSLVMLVSHRAAQRWRNMCYVKKFGQDLL